MSPSARLVPSFAALSNRRSMGSKFNFAAASSTNVSMAKAPMGAPGALYAVVFGLLSTTS